MARCGCSGTSCSCLVVGSGAITVTGSGSGGSPYIISGGGQLTVADTDTVDLSLAGDGSTGTPYLLSATAVVDMDEIADFDPTGGLAGYVVAFNGTSYVLQPPSTATPGATVTDGTLEGDGSGGAPLGITAQPTQTYVPAWTATSTNPSIGSGDLNGYYTEDPTSQWVDLSIDIIAAADTSKGSGYWQLSLPIPSAGRGQVLSAIATYANGTVRVGCAFLNGGGLITRISLSNPTSATGATHVTGSLMSTWSSGGHLSITGRYEREP